MIEIKQTGFEDLENVRRLWADGDVMKFVGFPEGIIETEEAMHAWLKRSIAARPSADHYSVYENGAFCGEASYDIDEAHKAASLDIKLFAFARGRGIAAKALSHAIAEAFKNGANTVWVDPNPENTKALALYERLGFVKKPMPDFVIEMGEDPNEYVYLELCKENSKGDTTMKFSKMPYSRPDGDEIKNNIKVLTERLKSAESYEEARAIFLEYDVEYRRVETPINLAYIRHSIDTRDEFYDAEKDFWDELLPEIEEFEQQWNEALTASPFRKDFEKEFGELLFTQTEMAKKTFSPEIIEDLQRENELTSEYSELLASARIPFEGGKYTLEQMVPFKEDADDARRLAAWQALGQWFKDNQAELDRIYDELTKLRDGMGEKLGYGGYTRLGYYRMERNCYTETDVAAFRAAVVKYVVPIAERIKREQAKRIGKSYPLSYADDALFYRSGNPRPAGAAEDILAEAKKFYDELSPETSEFFRTMLDEELMDVVATEGKEGGGYQSSLPLYERPFIFSNFNGTQGDIEVVTHEAGHAFAYWMNRRRVPFAYTEPSSEGCEVHSMSMEFFGWRNAEGFFGADAKKFKYSHLAAALTFIPYGTMVDHFQHIVYEKPELTPAERHEEWKRLLGIYQPWLRLDGEIPFFSEGMGWQRQSHIYEAPFYYIDYCLAQTVSLEFWAMLQKDEKAAWERYMAYTVQGGSRTFTELLAHANLSSPFDEACLKTVCEAAKKWLDEFDMTGME